jgi:hypothetical protein
VLVAYDSDVHSDTEAPEHCMSGRVSAFTHHGAEYAFSPEPASPMCVTHNPIRHQAMITLKLPNCRFGIAAELSIGRNGETLLQLRHMVATVATAQPSRPRAPAIPGSPPNGRRRGPRLPTGPRLLADRALVKTQRTFHLSTTRRARTVAQSLD